MRALGARERSAQDGVADILMTTKEMKEDQKTKAKEAREAEVQQEKDRKRAAREAVAQQKEELSQACALLILARYNQGQSGPKANLARSSAACRAQTRALPKGQSRPAAKDSVLNCRAPAPGLDQTVVKLGSRVWPAQRESNIAAMVVCSVLATAVIAVLFTVCPPVAAIALAAAVFGLSLHLLHKNTQTREAHGWNFSP